MAMNSLETTMLRTNSASSVELRKKSVAHRICSLGRTKLLDRFSADAKCLGMQGTYLLESGLHAQWP
jgi:hypothetical protein